MSSKFSEPGALFVAAQGAQSHGIKFVSEAISKGAVALLTDKEGEYALPALVHPEPRQIAGLISKEVYETPASGLFAVTGTNGKTSTAFYIQRLLSAVGKPAGLVSSAAQIVGSSITTSELTTPEAPRIHDLLRKMRSVGQKHAAIEVSAQALVRNRVDGLHFDIAGFSNLSRDHLDDFGSMEDYLAAKSRLFTKEKASRAVVNVEDQYGKNLFESIDIEKVGIGPNLDYQTKFENGQLAISGKHSLNMPFSQGKLMSKNFALALVMLLETGISPQDLRAISTKIDLQVPGRLQLVSNSKPSVFVDYAHTPAGVEAAVNELAERFAELTVVLGASGNRDKGKRSEMAKACQRATRLIITDQHPRDEDPAEIRKTLLEAASDLAIEVFEVPDPAEAIKKAVQVAGNGVVLWCGPGQLKYREIRGEKVAFDAIELARAAVERD
jgi:UDP-N-acetylmuramoyl-L-alanyl-D-glutamate--2,6-diaminopimelate ligase